MTAAAITVPDLAAAAPTASGTASVLHGRYQCAECLSHFEPKHWRSLFCCESHRTAWHNRSTVRGRTLTCLVMAARDTRGGSRGDTITGKRARRDGNILMQRWTIEDRAAKRMAQVEYLRRRLALGFEIL